MSQAVLCAVALVASASTGLWILYAPQAAGPASVATPPAVALLAVPRAVTAIPTRYSPLLDPAFTSGYRPLTFARSVPLGAGFERPPEADLAMTAAAPATERPIVPPLPVVSALVREIPLPAPRPARLASADARPAPTPVPVERRSALPTVTPEGAAPPADHRSFFDRMFRPPPPSALAYAAPEDGGLGLFGAARRVSPDHATAIYNISTHTVTLPDGTRLEAHSGLGAAKDNPNSVTEHMRGATPPNVYELEPREGLFHGVAALRLNPVGGTTYGREGLLAHTYMLGPRGDSNGCVVFKDYRAFRQAYDNGEVRRLVVVAGGD